ncbi:MAG: hypothetical protein ABI411_11885 [Tahibacter sp.]
MRHLSTTVAACLLLAACGGSDKSASTTTAPPPPQKTVIDTQLKALEKAKAMQETVNKQAEDEKKKIDDAGG